MGGVQGPATDIDIEAREMIKMSGRLSQIIATETGQSIERAQGHRAELLDVQRPRR